MLLGIEGAPGFLRIVRREQALPRYVLRHRERVEAAERRHAGLFLTGNAYRGLGVADCIRNAAPLADRVAAWLSRPVAAARLDLHQGSAAPGVQGCRP